MICDACKKDGLAKRDLSPGLSGQIMFWCEGNHHMWRDPPGHVEEASLTIANALRRLTPDERGDAVRDALASLKRL